MNSYDLAPDPETLATLHRLKHGVVSAATCRTFPHLAMCTQLFLQCADGRWIELSAHGEDLEFKFEVFTLHVRPAERMNPTAHHELLLTAPVEVIPLLTEDWLDPAIPSGSTLGSDPIIQCTGAPGSAPFSARAVCRYLGGVRFRDAKGVVLHVATSSFPYDLHITGISDDREFRMENYVVAGHVS
nr:hypothetical protein [Stenotrophomonas acidaminiphila]